jgi:hypothetical protein
MESKRTQWIPMGIAAMCALLAGCGAATLAETDEPKLPPRDDAPLARPAVVPETVLGVSKATPESGTQIVATARSASARPAPPPPPPPPPAPPDAAVERMRELQQAVQAWQQAWQGGDVDAYVRAYAPGYKANFRTRQAWEQDKKRRLTAAPIQVEISEVRWNVQGDNEAEVRFLQRFAQGRYRDFGEKTLRLRRIDGAWRITQESWRARKGG